MARKIGHQKLVVRKAKPQETAWLFQNKNFSVPYAIPEQLRKDWPCFVLLKGKEIIGYRSFEFHEVNGQRFAWVGSTSLRKGFEGQGLGPFLFGRSNAMLHAMRFDRVQTWAHEPRAKKFWTRMGYTAVEGAPLEQHGNTRFAFDLKKQREAAKLKRRIK